MAEIKIRHINKVVYDRYYNTNHIIEVVLKAYETESDSQISDLAQQLKGADDTETCRNVWQYLIDNIKYIADGVDQKIKSPARLVHDKVGDCKSYSLFTACILRELDIPHYFRFVSYSKRKEATHVYVVALINDIEIPIDAVAYVQARAPFGTEINYKYRADMKQMGKIIYMAGVGRPQVGAVTSEEIQAYLNSGAFDVWLKGETESELTLARGYLLSEWDMYWTLAAYAASVDERIEYLNRLQYIGAMLRIYDEFRDDNAMLQRAGRAFSQLIETSAFNTQESDPERRVFFSDTEHARVLSLMDASAGISENDFTRHWQETIIDANHRATDENGAEIGAVDYNSLRTNVKQTGAYYIYSLGISNSNISKFNETVALKRARQQVLATRTGSAVSTQMQSAELNNLYVSGCTEAWQASPAQVINDLKAGKINGAPQMGSVTVATVLSIITAIVSIIGKIVGWFKKDEVPSDSYIEAGKWNPSDITPTSSGGSNSSGLSFGGGMSEAGMSWILPALLVGGALFMAKKK